MQERFTAVIQGLSADDPQMKVGWGPQLLRVSRLWCVGIGCRVGRLVWRYGVSAVD